MDDKICAVKAKEYWKNAAATNDGVLGGFGHLNAVDARGSREFLEKLLKSQNLTHPLEHALDVGAGIGRVTQEVLLRYFRQIDLVEQNETFVATAKGNALISHQLGDTFCMSLQGFTKEAATIVKKYDVVWVQWVLNYLSDTQLHDFLLALQHILVPSGMVIIKENVTRPKAKDNIFEDDVYDEDDGSVTRSDQHFNHIFKSAGYQILSSTYQRSFPSSIFPVKMTALKL